MYYGHGAKNRLTVAQLLKKHAPTFGTTKEKYVQNQMYVLAGICGDMMYTEGRSVVVLAA